MFMLRTFWNRFRVHLRSRSSVFGCFNCIRCVWPPSYSDNGFWTGVKGN